MPLDEQGRLIGFPGDADWDDADDVSTDFGEKFKVGDNAAKGDIPFFVGVFQGVKDVPMPTEENPDEMAKGAEFLDESGNKCYCWLTFALSEALSPEADEPIEVGDIVRIEFKGRSDTKRGLNPVTRYSIKRIRPKAPVSA